MSKKFFVLISVFVFLLSTLLACGAWAMELRVPIDHEPDSLNLARVSDTYSSQVASQILEGLVCIVIRDGREVVMPACAESWETSEDGLTWTFHLREMKWADGEPLRAEEFVYGISRVLDPATASPISGRINFIRNANEVLTGKKPLSDLGVEAPDDRTLIIRLERPIPYLLQIAAGIAMFPVRRDVVEKYGDAYGTDADKFVGCGPFILEDWVHNSSLTFVKNPLYWDAANVKLKRIEMKIVAEEAARVGDFENGGLDFISVNSMEWVKKLDENPLRKGGYVKSIVQTPRTEYIFFNQTISPFSNRKVRQAFSLALNREEIHRDIKQGMQPAAWGWIPPTMNLDGESFRAMAGEPIQDLAREYPDPSALLVEGLKELGMSGEPGELKVRLMCRDSAREFAEYLQQSYKSTLGVELELDPVQWPVFQERNRNLDYEMGYKSYGADYNDPFSMMDLWITGTRTVPTGWASERYDALVREASQSTDKALRAKNYAEAERLVLHDATIAPYAYDAGAIYVQPRVKGFFMPFFTDILYKTVSVEE